MSESKTTKSLQEEVQNLKERVADLETRLDAGEKSNKGGDLRSLVKAFEPSTHVERALIIGYHLERHQGVENFTIKDIRNGYRDGKLKEPANMSDVLANAGERGLLRRDGEDDGYQMWMLTLDGEQTIEEVIEA